MFPTLLTDIPPFGWTLYTYGFMNFLAFVVATFLSVREGRRLGLSTGRVLDLILWSAIGGYAGARILFIIVNWRDYLRNPMALVSLEGGLVFYGGFILASIAIYLYSRRNTLPFLLVADLLAPQVALGLALGRMGCFSAGCCWGREAPPDFPFAARFTHPSGQPVINNLANVPLHPTQLYESFGLIILALILLFYRTQKRFHGEVFIAYLALYALLRTIVETFRGDGLRGFVIPDILSTSQFIALLLVISAVFLRWRSSRNIT
ncbi:MAG: prolipoprotein diacylglyceryl transferase [Myxococcota bacterium]